MNRNLKAFWFSPANGRRGQAWAAVGWLLAVVVGCSQPPQATVQGTVSLAGKPLSAGTIVFEAEGRSYTGTIGADGRYALRYLGQPGVLPGDYRIALVPPEPSVVADPKTTELKAVNPVDPRDYPERYRLPSTSGITKTVPAGDSTIDIDLPRP
jgi:hypothetical protein